MRHYITKIQSKVKTVLSKIILAAKKVYLISRICQISSQNRCHSVQPARPHQTDMILHHTINIRLWFFIIYFAYSSAALHAKCASWVKNDIMLNKQANCDDVNTMFISCSIRITVRFIHWYHADIWWIMAGHILVLERESWSITVLSWTCLHHIHFGH